MPLLYTVLRQALRWALDVYYVDIQRVGERGVPEEGPLIFAANHPNSIMDTVILGTQTSRQISYMARSGLFDNPASRWIFNQCGVIPIYRSQDGGEGETSKNVSSFERAWEVLEEGGCIGIFPEGTNAPERHVREIKTGTARIALEAEARNGFSLGVKIVPVGLNFEARTRFLTSVLIRFGEPIEVAQYAEVYRADPRGAVRALTDAIQEGLREEAVHIENQLTHDLVRDIQAIYGQELQRQLFGDKESERSRGVKAFLLGQIRSASDVQKDLEDHFFIKQRIADAIDYFAARRPEAVDRVRADVRRYKDHLYQIKLRHEFVDRPPSSLSVRKEAIKFTLYAIVFALPAVWGLVNNVVPYALSRAAWETAPEEAIRAIRSFGVAFFAFPIFYALQAWGLATALESVPDWPYLVALYLLSLPPAGFFWLRYSRQLARYRDRIMSRTFFRTNRSLVLSLGRERQRLLAEFEELKDAFVTETGSKLPEHLARRGD